MSQFVIRPMSREEIPWAIAQAAREGWNPGLQDAECFYQADPQGFLLGLLDGEPIGCISAVAYPENFGFIGLYIVVPEQRGKGYGIQLWQAAMTRLTGCNVGLDGVVVQQDNYRKSGFKLAYRNIRFAGKTGNPSPVPEGLTALTQVAAEQLAAYDRQVFPAPRPEFLAAWSHMPGSRGLACLESGQLQGYGLIRPCLQGYKIGPLFADTRELADKLFSGLTAELPTASEVFLDVAENNSAALALTESRQMSRVFETARMYTGNFPDLALDKQFGITTFELG